MTTRRFVVRHLPRELLFDAATAALGGVLVLLAATGSNRLPYPGDQHYARRATAILTAPVSSIYTDLIPELALPSAHHDETHTEE